MPGLSDYASTNYLNYVTGGVTVPTLPSVWCGLYTAMPTSDAGTGGTEVTGGAYARVQVAGTQAVNAITAAASAVLNFATVPAFVTVGMTVRDLTAPSVIPAATTVISKTGTTVTLSATVTGGGVGATDSIVFSAWPAATASVGTEPAVTPASVTNGAVVSFATATVSWGTVIGFGLFDALAAGNTLTFDYLGNFSWLPATVSTASPGVITAHAHGYNAADPVVVTQKYGGALPTFSQSNLTGVLAVVGPSADTFTVTNGGTAVNTSATGDFAVRKLVQQSIPSGVTASFAASSLTLTLA